MEFPTLVYKDGGNFQRPGGTYSFKSVKDNAEFDSALADGWSASIEFEAVDNSAPTRAELEEKATELGIKFDGRTKDHKLAALIEAALA